MCTGSCKVRMSMWTIMRHPDILDKSKEEKQMRNIQVIGMLNVLVTNLEVNP